jgi:hypothetical protein
MNRIFALACNLFWTEAWAQLSQQQLSLPCDAFVRNANGCWSSTRQVRIDASTGTGSIGPGMTFCTGTMFMGINLPEMLTQQCTRQ